MSPLRAACIACSSLRSYSFCSFFDGSDLKSPNMGASPLGVFPQPTPSGGMHRYKSCTVGSLQYNDAGAMAPASSRRGRSRGSIGQRHPDALEGRVLLQGVVGLVAPVAGLLHPAEGHGLVPGGPVVD